MNNKTYTPHPMNTDAVVLPKEIMELSEALAKNAHENYAVGRFREGWTYGPERNDVLKTNPTLIPYEELPESEKECDRAASMETLKMILALGYKIIKDE